MPPALGECIPDSLAPVLQLQQHKHRGLADDLAGRAVHRFRLPHQGHARGLAAGVQFQAQKLQNGILLQPIHQPDSERHHTMHPRPSTFQQQPRPFLRARHQRFLSFVQNKYSHTSSPVLTDACDSGYRLYPLGNVCNRLLPVMAAAGTFGAWPFASMIRALQSGELRKHSPVRLDDPLQT